MASFSSSSFLSTTPKEKYEVFLSFKGEDTRDNFTNHLYAALCRSKINTFIDDSELRKGDRISPSLLSAIEGSMISVIIFSQGYASSRWCLEELVKILQCMDMYGQFVIPVFYHVEPSHVRYQTGAFADGLAKLAKRYRDSLQTWKTALREAANLSGFDSKVITPETLLIENIIKDILNKLNDQSLPVDDKDLVGIDTRAEYIEWLLCIGFGGVQKLGIWGIGGIGKTTLANAVFKRVSKYFESSYFIQNIREESEKGRLRELGRELISAILGDKNPIVRSTFTKNRLSRKKVFIVFDDVTNFQQIEGLIGDLDNLGSGSRVIITIGDKQVLKNFDVDQIYEAQVLSYDDSLQLFSQYAFRKNCPKTNYIQLSTEVVKYAGGVPLALKTLGSLLFDRTEQEWQSTIKKLGKGPPMDILKVLKISYDGLDNEEKDMFLDIAHFYKGENINKVKFFFDACGFSSTIGIQILIEKCLITISSSNIIQMHGLLQEMGRAIVQQESIHDPGKRSRLWNHDDIYHVLAENMGIEAILGICLNMSKIEEIHLNHNAFTKMCNLRFLKLYKSSYINKVHGFEAVESNFRELRYFFFDGYPAKSLPSNFQLKNLVQLHLPSSNIEQLRIGNQSLGNLKHLDLHGSRHLFKISDLSVAPNLEHLVLRGCTRLQEISSSDPYLNRLVYLDLAYCCSFNSFQSIILSKSLAHINLSGIEMQELPPSISYLPRLVFLNLSDCSRLEHLPGNICELKSLKYLDLKGCSNLKMVPDLPCELIKLYLCRTGIRELPSSIEFLIELKELDLQNCSKLESLPNGVCKLKSLRDLYLSGCSQLDKLPQQLGNLEALVYLSADGTAIREVPFSVLSSKNLVRLSFQRCKMPQPLPLDFQLLPSVRLPTLGVLNLTDCCITELPYNVGQLSSIRELYLGGNNIESLPASIKDLTCLYTLNLSNCWRLRSLPELPLSLEELNSQGCTSLEAPSVLFNLLRLKNNSLRGDFINCFKVNWSALTDSIDAFRNIEFNRVHFHIYFPGSEIPKSFNFQSSGSLLHLPPDWWNDNFGRFALCVVVSFSNCENKIFFRLACDLIVDNEPIKMYPLLSLGQKDTDHIKSDHVLLEYNIKMLDSIYREGSKFYNKEAFIQFYFEDYRGEKVLHGWQMKKCGVHFFTGQIVTETQESDL